MAGLNRGLPRLVENVHEMREDHGLSLVPQGLSNPFLGPLVGYLKPRDLRGLSTDVLWIAPHADFQRAVYIDLKKIADLLSGSFSVNTAVRCASKITGTPCLVRRTPM
jgi:hypothetical protein